MNQPDDKPETNRPVQRRPATKAAPAAPSHEARDARTATRADKIREIDAAR